MTFSQLPGPDWLNVVTLYGADPAGVSGSTAAIQNAISALPASGGTVYFPAGTYKLTSALTVTSGTVFQGAGENTSILLQTSTTADAIDGTDVNVFVMRNMRVTGPSSGSGTGVHLTSSAGGNTTYVDISDCRIDLFGGDGIKIDNPIVSRFSRVVSVGHGGNGFSINGGVSGGAATSCVLDACYAISCTQAGYQISHAAYTSLYSCATDTCGAGYILSTVSSAVLSACGCESAVSTGGAYTGQSFEVTGCHGVNLLNCYSNRNASIGVWVTGSSARIVADAFLEVAAAGATASIQVDSGSTCTVLRPSLTTATSYTGTVNQYADAGSSGVRQLDLAGGGNSIVIRATTLTASGTNNQPVYMALCNDSGNRAYGAQIGADTTPRYMVDVNGNASYGTGSATRDTTWGRQATALVGSPDSDIVAGAAGKGFQVAHGTNQRLGEATLVAGTVTVANTTVSANTLILLTCHTSGGTQGFLSYSRSNGVSFTITSSSSSDTSIITYLLMESVSPI